MTLGCELVSLKTVHVLHLFDVCPCDEGFVFAGEDRDMDTSIGFQVLDRAGELFDGFSV